ncbi:MAG: hypothetical protein WCL17_04220 [Actinomycetota bacterium]
MKKISTLAVAALVVGTLIQCGSTATPASAQTSRPSFNVAGWVINSKFMSPAILKQVKAAERAIVITGTKSVTLTPYTDAYGPLWFNKYIGHARAFAIKQRLYSLLTKDHDGHVLITIAATTVRGKPRTLAALAAVRKVVISYVAVASGSITGLVTGIPRAADVANSVAPNAHNEFVFPTINGCAGTQTCYWVASVTAQLSTGGATYLATLNPNVVDGVPTDYNHQMSGAIAYVFTNLPAGSYTIQVNFAGLDYNSTAPVYGTAPNTYGNYTMFAGSYYAGAQVNGADVSMSGVSTPADGCQLANISTLLVPVTVGTTSTVNLNPRFFAYDWC